MKVVEIYNMTVTGRTSGETHMSAEGESCYCSETLRYKGQRQNITFLGVSDFLEANFI